MHDVQWCPVLIKFIQIQLNGRQMLDMSCSINHKMDKCSTFPRGASKNSFREARWRWCLSAGSSEPQLLENGPMMTCFFWFSSQCFLFGAAGQWLARRIRLHFSFGYSVVKCVDQQQLKDFAESNITWNEMLINVNMMMNPSNPCYTVGNFRSSCQCCQGNLEAPPAHTCPDDRWERTGSLHPPVGASY